MPADTDENGLRYGVYNVDYYCLTNNNVLLVKRNNKIIQIKPSEFEPNDLLPTLVSNKVVWTKAICKRSIVAKNESIVQINSIYGLLELTTGHKLFNDKQQIVAAGNLSTTDKLWKTNYFELPCNQSIGVNLAYVLGAFTIEESSQKEVSTYHKICDEKRVPSVIFSATKEEKAAYIAGLFESNGKLSNDHNPVIRLTSKFLIDGLHILLSDLGIDGKLTYQNNQHIKNKDTYQLSVYGKTNIATFVVKIGKYLSNWKHFQAIKNYLESIKPLEDNIKYEDLSCTINSVNVITTNQDIYVYDFTIPLNEQFLIGPIVSHNSGSQAVIYIGDVFVDEVISIAYQVSNNRTPLYGYADEYFRDVSKGHIFIQGQFSINFKEAGYMWLILNRYRKLMRDGVDKLQPFLNSQDIQTRNIEAIVNGEASMLQKNRTIQAIAEAAAKNKAEQRITNNRLNAARELGGFSSLARSTGGIGSAENQFEKFEDFIWGKDVAAKFEENRRADDPDLNPFEIYIAYGDFAGDNRANHTIQKLTGVHIIGSGKQITLSGEPISEQYNFIARNLI